MRNQNKFSLLICITAILLIYVCSTVYDKPLLTKVSEFESDYKLTLNELTDSLLKRKDLDTSYEIEFRRGYSDFLFSYLDSSGAKADHFNINFKFSKKQYDFFVEAGPGNITYKKKENCFEFVPFFFKDGEKTLLVIINKNKDQRDIPPKGLSKIYQKDNYSYFKVNAW